MGWLSSLLRRWRRPVRCRLYPPEFSTGAWSACVKLRTMDGTLVYHGMAYGQKDAIVRALAQAREHRSQQRKERAPARYR